MKTSQELYDEILRPVNTKYGAPMGRSSKGEPPTDCRIFDRAVSVPDGYDKGGAYWGLGPQLRVKYSQDGTYVEFYRLELNSTPFTPGPWEYLPHSKTNAEGYLFMPNAAEGVGCVISLIGAAAMNQEQLNANARLIAAAPKMYELLNELTLWVDDPDRYTGDVADIATMAKELLAKIK